MMVVKKTKVAIGYSCSSKWENKFIIVNQHIEKIRKKIEKVKKWKVKQSNSQINLFNDPGVMSLL